MRIPILTAILSFIIISSSAQRIYWNKEVTKGFVFQISNDEAQKLLSQTKPDTVFNGLLHTLIDTFDVSKGWINRPAKGHFIMTRIVGNKLRCEYTSVFPYQVLLLKEYGALSLQVLDLDGNVRTDAKVKLRWRRIQFDKESKTYRVENDAFQAQNRIVTVELEGFRSVFNIEKHVVPTWHHSWYDNDDGPSFYSYLITDKNKYKPGEKVRFKSYALSSYKFPLRKELSIWLVTYDKSINLGPITPHRAGSYAGEFYLHDSLKLILDKPYTLELRDRGDRIVSHCNFLYEDYELNGNKVEVTLDAQTQFYPASNKIFIKATDENGLILKDAMATVVVKTKSIRETFQPLVVLPDTLILKELKLNTDGVTTVEINPSIFQKTNTDYEVSVAVRNTQNQLIERILRASYQYSNDELVARFSNDSIVYEMYHNKVLLKDATARITYDNKLSKDMHLPYREKINASINSVRLTSGNVSRDIVMQYMLPKLELIGGIEKDSFKISLINSQKIDVSWYIYQGNILLSKGSGTELDYRSLITDRSETYYAEILYSFGGSEHLYRNDYEFRSDFLNVNLDVPDRVYPGQKVEALITVTDQAGNAIKNVDLTALAVTSKLNYNLPDLPYYGSGSSPRSMKDHYTKDDLDNRAVMIDLNYTKWEKIARLDTMKYYRFAYPRSKTFQHLQSISEGTQFAPYVMQNGVAKEIYVIEVDKKPVYFSWVDQPHDYAFNVKADAYHQITLRLYDRVLILDDVCFNKGYKTILSIDIDHLDECISTLMLYRKHKMKRKLVLPSFSPTEVSRYKEYISSFNNNYSYSNSFLEYGDEFTPLFKAYNSDKKSIVVGPITQARQTCTIQGQLKITYQHDGGYQYSFEDNVVYKLSPDDLIPRYLYNNSFDPMASVNDVAMTRERFLAVEPDVKEKWQPTSIELADYQSRVSVLLPEEKDKSGIGAFLFENSKTGEVVSPCQFVHNKTFYTIPRGRFNAIVLYNNGTYLKMNDVMLNSNSTVVADLRANDLKPVDSVSTAWLKTKSNSCNGIDHSKSYTKTESRSHSKSGLLSGNIQGTIYDEANMPLIGATVLIKGTADGTTADMDGLFALNVTDSRVTLVISFIGYATKEIEVNVGAKVSVFMVPDIAQLSEVVVVGYGMVKKSDLTGSVVSISGEGYVPPPAPDLNKKENDNIVLDETDVKEAENRLYQELLTLNHIRSHFSDVGFWEPRLFTDKHGQSRFPITFPDDITRWDAIVYAMNSRLQTGTIRKSIKSYKPIMATLSVPQFLTEGDSSYFIGKVLNYSSDKNLTGRVTWKGTKADVEKAISFTEMYTDNLLVTPGKTDSVEVSYSFNRDDGYLDGEERSVPVIEQGVERANGTLDVLKDHDDIVISASANEKVTVEILSTPIQIYSGDVRYLVEYKYACNEQLASKLLGLLQYKLLMQYEGKAFIYDRDVNKIIDRLMKNQNQEFLWSWWNVSPNTSYWMSAHILRALKVAKDTGYRVSLSTENLARKMEYKFEMLNRYSLDDVELVNALASWGAKLNYRKYIHKLDSVVLDNYYFTDYHGKRHRRYSSLLPEKMLLLEARQLVNLPYSRDSILQYKKVGILNDVHFSDNKPALSWYCNDLVSNSIAYRIVKRDSLLKNLITPMQLYFLGNKKQGSWNTYHSATVLMSILPDMLAGGVTKGHDAKIAVSGAVNKTIENFPVKLELKSGEAIRLTKESGMPLYYMNYVKERVTTAKTGVEGFAIKTTLNKQLKAGDPIAMQVEVDVTKDASQEYVMIEVPIPASCSYADKTQRWNSSIETHREYFKDRTVIFCERMKKGHYAFQIQLLPRFTGKYVVNPAQVSLMYVPVVNANTDMKKISVE